MKIQALLVLSFSLAFSFAVNGQKYLDSDRQTVSRQYQGQTITSDQTLSENLSKLSGMATYAGFMASYEEDAMKEDFMGTFFVIPDSGFEAEQQTEVLQKLAGEKGQKALVESLIVPGRLDAHELRKAALKNNGAVQLRSEAGQLIRVQLEGEQLYLIDSKGRKAGIVATDLFHKNGLFHILSAYVDPGDKG